MFYYKQALSEESHQTSSLVSDLSLGSYGYSYVELPALNQWQ